ncbi:MAG: hypothetical protein WA005_04630 [Candidatus Binataceae bacterium]
MDTYWKLCAGGDPGLPYTWSFSGGATDSIALAAGGISDYIGVNTASPIENSSGGQNASSLSILAPSVTTTLPNSLLIGAFGIVNLNGISAPGDMTDVYGHNSSDGPSVENAHSIQAVAGASLTETATATNSAGINIGQLIAVAPGP